MGAAKNAKVCEDCGCYISPHANHTGKERWCEDCFEEGLQRDLNEHWDNFWEDELGE